MTLIFIFTGSAKINEEFKHGSAHFNHGIPGWSIVSLGQFYCHDHDRAKTVVVLPSLYVLLQRHSGRNRTLVEITAIEVYRIQEGHREHIDLNKIIMCPWVRRVRTAQGQGEDMRLCTSDILGELEQIPCRDRKRAPGGDKIL